MHQQWKEGREAVGRVVETYTFLSGRSVPAKVVEEESAVNTGLLDRIRWKDIPTDCFLLNIRQLGITIGSLFWYLICVMSQSTMQ